MNVLSIWWGYCSGAALFREHADGSFEVLGGISEERFSRTKNTSVFPHQSIEWLKTLLPDGESFDRIVYASNDVGVDYLLIEKGKWRVQDYVAENVHYWRKVLFENEDLDYLSYHSNSLELQRWPGEDYWKKLGVNQRCSTRQVNENFNNSLPKLIGDFFGLNEEYVTQIDHHTSHAFYAIGSDPAPTDQQLVFTVDGWGDGRNAAVFLVKRGKKLFEVKQIFSSSNCALARIYRFMTLLLGMKPSEHEFKVMGLAPYGKQEHYRDALEIFQGALHFCPDAVDFVSRKKFSDSYFSFQDALMSERFDNIAAGLQKWLEDTLIDWVKYFVTTTGVADIAISGGVAMNCKAMGVLAEQEYVRSLHVPPSAGDESHILGAYYAQLHSCKGLLPSYHRVPYFGYQNNNSDTKAAIALAELKGYSVRHIDKSYVCDVLSQNGIVAVCRGRCEFGARALGNRSFLVDGSSLEAKQRLNSAVKNRDFWMPFAPIILLESAEEYLRNFKDLAHAKNRFMTVVFQTTSAGAKAMKSAVHPADNTCRAQILEKSDNPFIHDLISMYKEKEGRAALLNTSFNTHGHPIVNTAQEALDVFDETPTDVLILDDFMICKT